MLFLSFSLAAQSNENIKKGPKKERKHRIVFQLTSNDPEVHKGLMRQLGNVLDASPSTKMEIVCHGPGLEMLIKEKSTVHAKIQEFKELNVSFVACENTMKQKDIPVEAIIPEAGFVKAGIIEIVKKQEAGWSYIKAGN